MAEARVAVAGTEPQVQPGAHVLGAVDADEPIEVSVLVRPRASLESIDQRLARGDPPLSREQFAAQYGADASDLRAVASFAKRHGLAVVQSDAARRTVVLRGSAANVNDAFGVQLQHFSSSGGASFRAHEGPVYIPSALDGVVQAVLGLDTRPAAQSRRNR
ncbi:MAG: hypothetical protein JOZ81_00455 [Chloroflexi bacterium]|nr:hypothetical protein [Chloroflexota bacterium]MBV9546755.1 hypothetical protein [Chloroflexota bacterium]